jgi:hypothetical protein
LSADVPDANHLRPPAGIKIDSSQFVRFATATRGNTSSVALTLDNVKRSTEFKVVIEPSDESGSAIPIYRPHAQLSGSE